MVSEIPAGDGKIVLETLHSAVSLVISSERGFDDAVAEKLVFIVVVVVFVVVVDVVVVVVGFS